MDRAIPAVFSAGVFHPLEPVDLAQGTQVSVHCPVAKGADEAAADQSRRAWQDYLDRMESLPEEPPQDGFSNRDHDRAIYGA
jgi:predicted DNA-binding antitoxin AbrB/MazE fold protein